jgi:hypothetical protein
MNHDFENQLRQAMKQKDPPPDFTRKVMERIHNPQPQPKAAPWWSLFYSGQRLVMAGSLAAFLLVGGVGYHQYEVRRQEEQRRALAARDQVMLALRMTSAQFDRAGRQLARSAER